MSSPKTAYREGQKEWTSKTFFDLKFKLTGPLLSSSGHLTSVDILLDQANLESQNEIEFRVLGVGWWGNSDYILNQSPNLYF